MEMESDTWLSFDEHAAAVGVHVKTLIRWARHGVRGVMLKHRRLGIRYQTTKAYLDEFFATGTAATPNESGSSPPATLPTGKRQQAADWEARKALGLG